MAAPIRFAGFEGIAPAVAPELLADMAAQIATNCDLVSGDVRPLHQGVFTATPSIAGTIRSIYRIKEGGNEAWLAWAAEVTCVKGPILGLGRYYYTGDGEPRATNYALASSGGAGDYPKQFRALGLAKPITAPTLAPAGGVGAAVSRFYCYTFYDEWDQESAPSPLSAFTTGKVDDTWAVSNMDAAPNNTGNITNVTYTGPSVTIVSNVTPFNRAGERITIAGVTTVTGVNGTWTLTGVNVGAKTMTFTVDTTPTGAYNDGTDTTDTWSRVAPFGTCTKRIYRTSGSVAQFQLAAEGVTGTSYNDNKTDAQIPGDELISGSWEMPPVDLHGLCLHPSGALVGFSGNELCASEPYQPHAWPPEYRLRTDYPIRAVAVYGSNVAVATDGVPYVAYGTEPGQIALQRFDSAYPCLSTRSMVPTLTGAVYASSSGLVQVSDNGPVLISTNMYDQDQWDALQPGAMFGAFAQGNLYYAVTPFDQASQTNEPVQLLVFGAKHVAAEVPATALYTDAQDGKLYYALEGSIYAFNQPGTEYMYQDWKSKEIVVPEPRTLTAAKILFDTAIPADVLTALQTAYNAALAVNQALYATGAVEGASNQNNCNTMTLNGSRLNKLVDPGNSTAAVSFSLYVDGVLKYSVVVTNNRVFRLPSGYQATRFAIRLYSTCRIKVVELADNPTDLKRA